MSSPSRAAFPSLERGSGLTKREYAAIHILAGAGGLPGAIEDDHTIEELAEDAVYQADALLAALKGPRGGRRAENADAT